MSVTVPNPSDAELFANRFPEDRDCSEDAGFIITASTDEHDIYIYMAAYLVRSRGKGIWIKPDGRLNGTIFYAIPKSARGGDFSDNRFVRHGWHVDQYLEPEDHVVEIGDDVSRWQMGGRTYEWREGEWHVTGSHGGVDVDLIFRPDGAPEWRWGPFENMEESDSAGYKICARVSGTVTVDGKAYELKDAFASCERAAVGQSRDIVAELNDGAETTSLELRADGMDLQVHDHRARGLQVGTLIAGDRRVDFGPWIENSTVKIEDTKRWSDPRSGLGVPVAWAIELDHPDANVKLNVSATGRSWFHYNTKGGVMLLMQMIAHGDGIVKWSDGTEEAIEKAIVGVRWGRALMFATETLEGAEL